MTSPPAEPDEGRGNGLWGWQNEVWALLFAVVAFERLYRLAVTPLEWGVGGAFLVSTAVVAVGLASVFTWRWWRERRRSPGGPSRMPSD